MRPFSQKIIFAILLITSTGIALSFFERSNSDLKKTDKSRGLCTRVPAGRYREGGQHGLLPIEDLKWKQNSNLGVYFSSGSPALRNKILLQAKEWNKYCNINFHESNNPFVADVRITFAYGDFGSMIGTESKKLINRGKHSMFLQGLDITKNKALFRRTILHEFGHALGLEHELQKPGAAINWNKKVVYAYYINIHGWDSTKVDRNIFSYIRPENKYYEQFDESSIMGYAVPDSFTLDRKAIPWPSGLSKVDERDIAKWYPKR